MGLLNLQNGHMTHHLSHMNLVLYIQKTIFNFNSCVINALEISFTWVNNMIDYAFTNITLLHKNGHIIIKTNKSRTIIPDSRGVKYWIHAPVK